MRAANRRMTVLALVGVLGILGGSMQVGADDGRRAYGESRLKGVYGGLVQGVVGAGTPDGPIHFAAILVLTFDGAGGFAGTLNSSFGGMITGATAVTGSYEVEPDGTGSLVTRFPGGLPDAHIDFVLVDNGKEMLSFQTDAAHVNVGILKRR